MLRPNPTSDRRSFRRRARERAFSRLIFLRLFFAPSIGAVALTFAFFEPTLWRRVILGVGVTLLLALTVEEFLRARRDGLGALMLPLNLGFMGVGHLAVVATSGGVFSPVVPAAMMLAVLSGVLLDRRAALFVVLGVQAPAFWAMAAVHGLGWPVGSLIPELFGGAMPLEHGIAPWCAAAVYTGILFGGSRIGILLRTIFEDLFDDAMHERDRVLAVHADQARALTALSAELAHELKNPLASVKGLAALLAKGAEGAPGEAKRAERLGVLRREVDRMQGILEELLTFSRPLVPLSMEPIELAELARDVASLHEASAADREVRLEVRADEPVTLRADPRKLRQVLINLVQNALDASPKGGRVTLVVEGEDDSACVRVLDEGAGIDPGVRERLFEPGVTSKRHGSGLGLVVARSLARQHGGELTLTDRAEGGAEGILVLPREARA